MRRQLQLQQLEKYFGIAHGHRQPQSTLELLVSRYRS